MRTRRPKTVAAMRSRSDAWVARYPGDHATDEALLDYIAVVRVLLGPSFITLEDSDEGNLKNGMALGEAGPSIGGERAHFGCWDRAVFATAA